MTKGIVIEALPNLTFKVKLEDGNEVICYTSGRMRMNKIKVLVGDKVELTLDPHGGKGTNRITKRL